VGWAILALLGSGVPLAAQGPEARAGATLSVAVRSLAGALPAANVALVDVEGRSAGGGVSDGQGRVILPGLPPGSYTVQVEALGYEQATRETTLGAGLNALTITLGERALELDPLVVTGTLSETRVSDSPVKVEVVSSRVLARHASQSLVEAVGRINGLNTQVDCGVCYTNNIRINGMEGPYTAVLIDGLPIMGALASVYGLNGIHPSMVERLEILKGPQSTLYGTEAMGGVVNVITKDARFTPRFALEGGITELGQGNVAFSWSPGSGRSGTLLSGAVAHNDRFLDGNDDGFSDLTLDTRVTLFGKTAFRRHGRQIGGLTAKLYYEDRFGGLEGWGESDLGSSTVYGESIRTHRAELMGELGGRGPWRAQASYAFHRQDSWYGDTPYAADQHVGFAQVLLDPHARADGHDLLFGASLKALSYDDNTPATPRADRRIIPGLFAEDQYAFHPQWTALGGVRLDFHTQHGVIASPRASLMWRPGENTTFRVNAGTGFRVVNLFTEDHAALTGAREVVIPESLDPERSRSVTLNYNQILELGANPMMVDVDLFHTDFSNRIIPDYDADPDLIVYRNLDGRRAVTRGAALSLNQNFGEDLPLFYTVGLTVQDVFIEADGVREAEFFAPDWRSVWSLRYTFRPRGGAWIGEGGVGTFGLDYSGALTGPMRLPEYPEPFTRPTRSPTFATHDVQFTWAWQPGREVVLGVRNLGDFTQGSPLVAPSDPFGPAFDTNYVYGPVVGRTLTFGFRWTQGR
jgi:outer membrane receptor for ferrienterochelin and colicins